MNKPITEYRGHRTVTAARPDYHGRPTSETEWITTVVTKVTFEDGPYAGLSYASRSNFRSATEPTGTYFGQALGGDQQPWQRYQDARHAEALAELLAFRVDTTDMRAENWATRVLLAAGMHAEMMA
jgi:hypothetical protein